MKRVNIFLAALMPVLLLGFMAAPNSRAAAKAAQLRTLTDERHGHDSGRPDFSISHFVQRPVRRIDDRSGSDAPPQPTVLDANSLSQTPLVITGQADAPVVLRLVQAWQFDCRAVAEPRAPSSVS